MTKRSKGRRANRSLDVIGTSDRKVNLRAEMLRRLRRNELSQKRIALQNKRLRAALAALGKER